MNPRLLSNNKLTSKNKIEWVKGQSLTDNREILIPANTVLIPYPLEQKYGFMPQSTTGLASGITMEKAIQQATFEVLERNSYSLTHKSLLPVKDICLKNTCFDYEISNLLHRLRSRHIKVEATLLPESHYAYIVHVVLVSESYPKFTHGSGASGNIILSFRRALTEAIQMRTSQLLIRSQKQMNASPDNNVAFQWGIGKQNLPRPFRHGIQHEQILLTDQCCQDVHSFHDILDTLSNEGFEVFFVDLTKEETGLNVVKVIIPLMQDIDPFGLMTKRRLLDLGYINHDPMYS